ncbi:MAG TPA: hypothetical protein PLS28_04755 [Clostridiales bacterium]|nr:hypothetical protein [Clostridiales bacterium]
MDYENNNTVVTEVEESLPALLKEKLISLGKDKILPMIINFAKDELLPLVLENLKDIVVNDILPYIADKLSGIFGKKEN